MESRGPTATRRGLALAVLSATQLMVILDGTIVNVALSDHPRGARDSPRPGLAWVVNALLRTRSPCCCSPPGGSATWSGPRRVFLSGLAVFTARLGAGGHRVESRLPCIVGRARPGRRWRARARPWCSGMIAGALRGSMPRAGRGPSACLAFVGSAGRLDRASWPAVSSPSWPRGAGCSSSTCRSGVLAVPVVAALSRWRPRTRRCRGRGSLAARAGAPRAPPRRRFVVRRRTSSCSR